MQFLILGYDGTDADALNRRMAARAAHIALGDALRDEGRMIFAAAILNDSGTMCGSTIVVDFPDRDALDAYLQREPYVTGDVWRQVEVRPCKVGPSFQHLLGNASEQ